MAVLVCRFSRVSVIFQGARGHVANLKGLVFACYLSARHRPSQVTATPQPICVITTAFSHFPDNALHPHAPIPPQSLATPPPPPPCFFKSPSLSPFILLSPSFILLLLTLLYFCNPPSSVHYFILLLNPSFYNISSLFLFSLLSSFPCALAMLPLSPCPAPPPTHSAALSPHQKVLDFDICLQEQ